MTRHQPHHDLSRRERQIIDILYAQGRATASEYVIEYGIGTNAVDTQAGAPVGGLYPVDRSSLLGDNNGCRDDAGSGTPLPTGPNIPELFSVPTSGVCSERRGAHPEPASRRRRARCAGVRREIARARNKAAPDRNTSREARV